MSNLRSRAIVAAGTSTIVALSLTATASAGATTVTAAVKAQIKATQSSPAYKKLSSAQISTIAEAKQEIPEFKALADHFEHAAAVVSNATAASSKQKAAQTDWVRGAREAAQGIGLLDTALKDIVDGKKAAAKTDAAKAVKEVEGAAVLGKKADKMLGVPTS